MSVHDGIEKQRELQLADQSVYLGDGAYAYVRDGEVWVVGSMGTLVHDAVCLDGGATTRLIRWLRSIGVDDGTV